jgi:Domain of unknown function (DUF1906)
MGYAGIDTARYPGNEAMQWLCKETNLWWTGLYLSVGGIGLTDKATWRGKYPVLRNMGWGVAPLYVGKQRNSPKLKARAGHERLDGYLDGTEASALALREAIPTGCVLYFDYEGGDQPTRAWMEYYAGWVQAVLDFYYYPGVYCSHRVARFLVSDVAQRLERPGGQLEVWSIKYDLGIGKQFKDDERTYPNTDPGSSGYSDASCWQMGGNCSIPWVQASARGRTQRLKVDLNSSVYQDPGTCTSGA